METNDPVAAAEILAVLEAEARAFWEKDIAAFTRCWATDPFVTHGGWWQRGGVAWHQGWGTISDRIAALFAANPGTNPSAQAVRRENLVIRVGSDMAWATFDQYAPATGEPDMDMPGLSHETRIFERRKGRWVIVHVGYLLVG
jgi:SnoaL-like domain